jgi:hypothetical protein
VPPLTGAAVNVTDDPSHILVAEALIVTDGVIRLLTVMVITLLVAGLGRGHTAFDVSNTVTLSPLTSDDELKLVPPVPAFTPLTCH